MRSLPFGVRHKVLEFSKPVLLLSIGVSLFYPIFSRFAELFAPQPVVIGFLVSLNAIVSFLADAPVGDFVDRYRKKRVLLWGVALLATGLAIFYMSKSIEMFVLASIFTGVGGSAIWVPARAIMYDLSTRKTRGQDMGAYSASYDLGWTIGPFAGGFIAYELGFTQPFLFGAAICLAALALFALKIPDKEDRGESLRASVKDVIEKDGVIRDQIRLLKEANPSVLLSVANKVLLYVTWTMLVMMIPLAFTQLNEAEVGITLFTLALPFGVLGVAAGGLIDRFGRKLFMVASAAIAAPLILGYVLANGAVQVAALSLAVGAALTSHSIALEAIIADSARPRHKGSLAAVTVLSGDLGWLLGPITSGVLMQLAGAFAPFAFCAAILAVLSVVNVLAIKCR
jgi:DHA1 family multidrug resistance protein-like MFS transporter